MSRWSSMQIELGAGVESPTSSAPSALVCALSALLASTPRGAAER